MIQSKYYKKNHIWKYISCHSTLGRYIHRISPWAQSPHFSVSSFYPGDLANRAGTTIIFFFIATLINQWFGKIITLARIWNWLQLHQRYFFIDNRTWWYLLSPYSLLVTFFCPYFAVTNLWVFRPLRHSRFLGENSQDDELFECVWPFRGNCSREFSSISLRLNV